MDKALLVSFWEEAKKDPQKRVFFHKHFGEFLKTLPEGQNDPESDENTKKGTWTDSQRKAFHKGCEELADYLNAHGLDMRTVLKETVDIPWTKDAVKEHIFRPLMKAMYGYESHNELQKIEEVSALWNVAMKHLGERHQVELIEFPNDKAKQENNLTVTTRAKAMEYPEDPFEGQKVADFGEDEII